MGYYGRRANLFRNLIWAEVSVLYLKLVNMGSRAFTGFILERYPSFSDNLVSFSVFWAQALL